VKKLVLGSTLALVLVAAGCGGGSKTLSKEEYGTQLNKICSDLNAKNKAIGDPNSIAEVATKGPKLLDAFDNAIADVKKLKPPAEIKDAAARFISLGEQERGLISDLIDAAKKKDDAKINELGSKIDPLDKESNDIAKNQRGAPACAQG